MIQHYFVNRKNIVIHILCTANLFIHSLFITTFYTLYLLYSIYFLIRLLFKRGVSYGGFFLDFHLRLF